MNYWRSEKNYLKKILIIYKLYKQSTDVMHLNVQENCLVAVHVVWLTVDSHIQLKLIDSQLSCNDAASISWFLDSWWAMVDCRFDLLRANPSKYLAKSYVVTWVIQRVSDSMFTCFREQKIMGWFCQTPTRKRLWTRSVLYSIPE